MTCKKCREEKPTTSPISGWCKECREELWLEKRRDNKKHSLEYMQKRLKEMAMEERKKRVGKSYVNKATESEIKDLFGA